MRRPARPHPGVHPREHLGVHQRGDGLITSEKVIMCMKRFENVCKCLTMYERTGASASRRACRNASRGASRIKYENVRKGMKKGLRMSEHV